MLQAHHRVFTGSIFLVDLVLVASGAALSRVWPLGGLGVEAPGLPAMLLQASFLMAAWALIAMRLGLYHSRRTESMRRELRVLVEGACLVIGLGFLPGTIFLGHFVFDPLASLVFTLGLLVLQRFIVRGLLSYLRLQGYNYRFVLIVGHGRSARVLLRTLEENGHYGIRVLGSVAFPDERERAPDGIRDFGAFDRLQAVLAEYTVDAVLLCPSPDARAGAIQEVFETCDLAGINCHYAPSFFTLRHLAPSVVWYGELPVFAFRPGPASPVGLILKRGIDLVGSGLGLILLSPVLIGCALAVKLQDGGPVFFRQARLGRNGRPFFCLKFRSMCLDAEDKKREIEAANEQEGPVFKIEQDPRITRVGRFIRKYSFDELPQLINVFFGDMSLVGPRPPLPSEVIQYDWWQRRRLSVRPGITCIWQVSGRNEIGFDQWMEMDLHYIDHWSLMLDAKLLAKTVKTVFKGTGV